MLPTDKFFVPREEILKLTSNSFEARTVRIEGALKEEKKRLFEGAEPQLLGTFEGHAVVLTDAGKMFKVYVSESVTGSVHLMKAEPIQAPVYPREAMPTFLRKEARAITDLFLKGLVSEANRRAALLVKLVDENTVYDDQKIVDPLITSVVSSRAWKQALEQKEEAELKQLLGESFDKIEANKLQPKFSKLYDGSLSSPDLEQYRGLVNEDVGHLMGRLEAVHKQALNSIGILREFSETVNDSQRETVAAFVSFVEDLAEDTRQVKKTLSEVLQGVEGLGALGRLFDTLAEELLRYEIAGSFAVQMTTRLAQASR
jgi:hypothetical protein